MVKIFLFWSFIIELILPESISILNLDQKWQTILLNDSRTERIKNTINHWQKYAHLFELLIDLFKEKLISIDTIRYNEKICILYSLKFDEHMSYYVGYLPINFDKNSILNKLSNEIKSFYTNVHNGFVAFELNDMGLMPIDKFYCLGEDLLQEEFIAVFSVNDSYLIFSNGAGDGVLFDVSIMLAKCLRYYHDDYEFSKVIDEPVKEMNEWIIDQLLD